MFIQAFDTFFVATLLASLTSWTNFTSITKVIRLAFTFSTFALAVATAEFRIWPETVAVGKTLTVNAGILLVAFTCIAFALPSFLSSTFLLFVRLILADCPNTATGVTFAVFSCLVGITGALPTLTETFVGALDITAVVSFTAVFIYHTFGIVIPRALAILSTATLLTATHPALIGPVTMAAPVRVFISLWTIAVTDIANINSERFLKTCRVDLETVLSTSVRWTLCCY